MKPRKIMGAVQLPAPKPLRAVGRLTLTKVSVETDT
jgi:hypothetical protein